MLLLYNDNITCLAKGGGSKPRVKKFGLGFRQQLCLMGKVFAWFHGAGVQVRFGTVVGVYINTNYDDIQKY